MTRPITGGAPQDFFITETPLEAVKNCVTNTVGYVINYQTVSYASATIGAYFLADAILDGVKSKHETPKDEPMIHFVPKTVISALAVIGGCYCAVDKAWAQQLCCLVVAARALQFVGDYVSLSNKYESSQADIDNSNQEKINMYYNFNKILDEMTSDNSMSGSTPLPDSDPS